MRDPATSSRSGAIWNTVTCRLAELGVLCALWLFQVLQGARLGGDSQDYILGRAFRSPGYVLLLKLWHNAGLTFNYLSILQVTIGLLACWMLSDFIRHTWSMNWLWRPAMTLFLFIPYVFKPYMIGNSIQSEAVTFPLYLLFMSMLITGTIGADVGKLMKALAVLALLMLVRKQFMFALSVVPLIGVYLAHIKSIRWPVVAALVIASAVCLMVTELAERGYSLSRTGSFSDAPYLGVQLVSAPLYFATDDDANLMQGETRRYFELFRYDAKTKGFSYDALMSSTTVRAEHYLFHYDSGYILMWMTMLNHFGGRQTADWRRLDDVTMAMTWPLLKRHWKQVLALEFNKIKFEFGGYYGLLAWVSILGACIYALASNKATPALEVFSLALVLMFSNALLIAFLQPFLRRYTIYTEPMMYLTAAIVVYESVKRLRSWKS